MHSIYKEAAAGVVLIGLAFLGLHLWPASAQPVPAKSSTQKSQSTSSQPESFDFATSTTAVRPVSLSIPAIGVDTSVESVGIDDEGRMATPSDWREVAWYQSGFLPGEKGNAVFAGHLDWDGNQAVFWDLNKLQSGDIVQVQGDDRELSFLVTTINEYDYALEDTEKIFGSATTSRIKLITCDGEFIEESSTYQKRLVVTAELITHESNSP